MRKSKVELLGDLIQVSKCRNWLTDGMVVYHADILPAAVATAIRAGEKPDESILRLLLKLKKSQSVRVDCMPDVERIKESVKSGSPRKIVRTQYYRFIDGVMFGVFYDQKENSEILLKEKYVGEEESFFGDKGAWVNFDETLIVASFREDANRTKYRVVEA